MIPAAEVMPASPKGAKSARLSEFQPCSPSTMNSTSTAILIITITALTFADSLEPRISSSVHRAIRITAGRLSTPPCSGACDSASGIMKPNRLSNSSFRYCDQPTATAAADTPYSSSRQAATPIGRQLAERRVRVGVRRAGHRYGAGQLGVADRGEPGDHAGDHERPDHRRPSHRDRLGQDEEDAGADRGADAEHRQLEQTDRPGQLTLAGVGAGLLATSR